jgi:phosphohistidine phosphatase
MTDSSSHHLVVMRHAKAEQSASSDHARRLTDRGRADARAAGPWLEREGYLPDQILVSSAARAEETAQQVADSVDGVRIDAVDELYGADAHDVIALLKEHLSDDATTAMVVGHNPTMEELAFLLQGDGARELHLPTSGLAVFDCGEGPWSHLEAGRASVVASYNPRG